MKKLFIINLVIAAALILIPAQNAMSNIYGDFFGLYNDTGDAESQLGFGLAFGVDFAKDVSFLGKGIWTSKSKNENLANEEKYSHEMFMGGIGYGYNIPVYRLVWRSGILLGYSSTETDLSTIKRDDSGLCYEITTGIQWNVTQHVSPFLDIGFHQSFYAGDLKDASIGGLQVLAGIRFSLFSIKRISEDY